MNKAMFVTLAVLALGAQGAAAQDSVAAQAAPADTTAARELKEIVVEGERIIHKPGCEILLLSDANRKVGVNALEAISSLNYFRTSIGDTKLISYDDKPVLITIDGVPSTGIQLCTFKADQIVRVEYFAVTPAEYMDQTNGPVINVITRRPVARMVSGYFMMMNSVYTVDGMNSASLTYADSLNRVQAFYNIGYSNLSDIEKHSRYEYTPDHIADYIDKGKLVSTWHGLDLVYQRDQGPHMFSVTLSGGYDHSKERYNGVADIVDGMTTAGGTSFDFSKVHSKRLGLNLYYRLKIGSRSDLAFSVGNTFGRSGNDATLRRDVEPPYDALNYDITSDTRNKTYALSASTAYSLQLPNGYISAFFRYSYNRLNQTSQGIAARPETNSTYTSLQYVWMKNGFSIIPSIGLSTYESHTTAGKNTSVSPVFRFSSKWNAQGKTLKGWSVNLNYNTSDFSMVIGNLANSVSYIDNYFISMGNPDVRRSRWHGGSLRIQYMSPDGKNSFYIQTNPGYEHHALAPVLLPIDGLMVLRYDNIRYSYSNGVSARASWYVMPWLELSSYGGYSYSRNAFHDGSRASYGQWRIGGSVYASMGHFELSGSFNPPIKQLDGNLFKRRSTQAVARLRYKLRDFSVACEYRYHSQNDYTIGRSGSFNYIEDSSRKSSARYIGINLTYSFSKGKQINHDDPTLNDASYDTGLGSFNGVAR